MTVPSSDAEQPSPEREAASGSRRKRSEKSSSRHKWKWLSWLDLRTRPALPPRRRHRGNRRPMWQILLAVGLLCGTASGGWWWMKKQPNAPAKVELANLRYNVERTFEKQEFAATLDHIEKLEAAGGGSLEVTYKKALCQSAIGNSAEAEKLMTRLVEINDDARAHLWLGEKLVGKPELLRAERELAERHFEAVLKHDPRIAVANRWLAKFKLETGRPQEAFIHFDRLASQNFRERIAFAKLLLQAGQATPAKEHAAQALREYILAIEKQPAQVDLRLGATEAAAIVGDFQQAEDILLEGLKQTPQDAQLIRAISHFYLAWAEHRARQVDATEPEVFNLLLKSIDAPQPPELAYQRIALFALNGKVVKEQAHTALFAALMSPQASSGLIHNLLADVAQKQKRPLSAWRHWEMALAADPTSAVAWNNLSVIHYLKQPPDLPLALNCINRAIQLAPQAPPLRGMRGRILVSQGQFQSGLKDLQDALKAAPQDPTLHSAAAQELSRFHANRGERQRAEDELHLAAAWYAKQMDQQPESPIYRIKLAEIAVLQQDYSAAIAFLEAGLQFSNPATFRDLLGQVYQARGANEPGGNQATPLRLANLRQAVRYNPKLRGAVAEVLRISQGNSSQAQPAADLLAIWAKDPPTAGLTNSIMGAAVWSRGDKTTGRKLLEIAFRFDPDIDKEAIFFFTNEKKKMNEKFVNLFAFHKLAKKSGHLIYDSQKFVYLFFFLCCL